MKARITSLMAISMLALSFFSCEKEDGEEELDIHFKTGGAYLSTDTTLAGGSAVLIGIEADTEKKKDPILRFNISESVDGAAASTVYTEDMEVTEYDHDYSFTLDTTSGSAHVYTFTITNRDGKIKQETLAITVQ